MIPKFRVFDEKSNMLLPLIGIRYSAFNRGEIDYVIVEKNEKADMLFNSYVLMQWTGFKDQEGVDIYEGDIVQAEKEKHYYKVVRTESCGCFKFENSVGVTLGYFMESASQMVRIVSNIYKNPEFLK